MPSCVKHYINQGEAISYSYDENGNISSIQSPDGSSVTYTYDSLNQLVSEHYSTTVGDGSPVPHNAISYEYDTRGNILSKIYSLNGLDERTEQYTRYYKL
ncbi:MAG: RHS repeat protein [Clostridia bacterium]|nr:RHS repeat protein [Clostridia bacterium]